MKKILIVIAVIAVFAVVLGFAGYAYAQTTAPLLPQVAAPVRLMVQALAARA